MRRRQRRADLRRRRHRCRGLWRRGREVGVSGPNELLHRGCADGDGAGACRRGREGDGAGGWLEGVVDVGVFFRGGGGGVVGRGGGPGGWGGCLKLFDLDRV